MKHPAIFLLCLLIEHLAICAVPSPDEKIIEGTALSGLNNAYEVLQRLSSLTEDGTFFSIAGQGVANIYVDERRLSRHTDLMMIPASAVHSVEILTEAHPEYGNSESVILITLVERRKDSFNLTDVAGVKSAPMVSGSNDLDISGRKDKFYYEGGLALSYTGVRDDETRTENEYASIPGSSRFFRELSTVKEFAETVKDYAMNLKADLGYEFNPYHKLSAGYEYDYDREMTDWGKMSCTETISRGSKSQTNIFPAESVGIKHKHRHSFHLGYSGKTGGWKIVSNLDFYRALQKEDNQDYETRQRRESVLNEKREFKGNESYFKLNASHRLWKGNVRFGIMMDDRIQDSFIEDLAVENNRIHAKVYSALPGAFVSLAQNFGSFGLGASLQYQMHVYRYTPYDDDITRQRIIEMSGDGKIKKTEHFFQPKVLVSVPVGAARISTGIQSMNEFPPAHSLFIRKEQLETGDLFKALPQTERKDEFFLKGEWKWLEIRGWATHSDSPLFRNIDYENDFNGPSHWAMDWRLTLSPSVAFWESGFTAEIHKQWMEMDVVDPADKLKDMLATFNWNNSFSMPWGMNADVMTMVRTRGAQGNMFYREPSWKVDFAVRQTFLKGHLSLTLLAENIFHRQCDSIAFYTKKQELEFDFNERFIHRAFSLSLKYTL